jgi:hypothetical protein
MPITARTNRRITTSRIRRSILDLLSAAALVFDKLHVTGEPIDNRFDNRHIRIAEALVVGRLGLSPAKEVLDLDVEGVPTTLRTEPLLPVLTEDKHGSEKFLGNLKLFFTNRVTHIILLILDEREYYGDENGEDCDCDYADDYVVEPLTPHHWNPRVSETADSCM